MGASGNLKGISMLFVIRYGQLVGSDIMKSVLAFIAGGVSPVELTELVKSQGGLNLDRYSKDALEQVRTNGIIYKYKAGLIDSDTFLGKLKELIPNCQMSKKELIHAWNSMCSITSDKDKLELKGLQELLTQNSAKLLVVGRTNQLQDEYIKQQLREIGIDTTSDNRSIDIVTSYQNNTFDDKILLASSSWNLSDYEVIDLRESKDYLSDIKSRFKPKPAITNQFNMLTNDNVLDLQGNIIPSIDKVSPAT